MNGKSEIRYAQVSDAEAISGLIMETSVACCFSPVQPCPEWYRDSVQPNRISSLISAENIVWLVAVQEGEIVGVLAVKESRYIKYYFVRPVFQNLGIGRRLWKFALINGVIGSSVEVRSSLFAVPVYERLGFKTIESPKSFHGLCFQTMVATFG